MKLNYNTDKLIILFFPAYAGGKFLSNCLALSKFATFQNAELALIDIKLRESKDYYNWKLKTALKSLPTMEQISSWLKYEYGCDKLFNWSAHDENFSEEQISYAVKLLSNLNDTNFFIVSHGYDDLCRVKKYFSNAKILILTDYLKFIEISYKIKQEKLTTLNLKKDKNFLKKISHCNQTIKKLKYDYKVSFENIFNEEFFIEEIHNLYKKLNYNDFNEQNIKIFYKQYIDLHIK